MRRVIYRTAPPLLFGLFLLACVCYLRPMFDQPAQNDPQNIVPVLIADRDVLVDGAHMKGVVLLDPGRVYKVKCEGREFLWSPVEGGDNHLPP